MLGACLLLWKVPARQRLHSKTAKMVLVASRMLSRSQVDVHSWVESVLPQLPLSILGFHLLTIPKIPGAVGLPPISLHSPSPPNPFTHSELSPNPMSLPWDETGLGVVCLFCPYPGKCAD